MLILLNQIIGRRSHAMGTESRSVNRGNENWGGGANSVLKYKNTRLKDLKHIAH